MDGYPDNARLDLPGGPHEAAPVTLTSYAKRLHEDADEKLQKAIGRVETAALKLGAVSLHNTTGMIVLATMLNGLVDAMETVAAEVPR
jgi:hypothetical protein